MSSKLASLHAGLVVRKGEAMPAISHPSFSYIDAPRPAPQPVRRDVDAGLRRSFASPAARLQRQDVEMKTDVEAMSDERFSRPFDDDAAPPPSQVVRPAVPRQPVEMGAADDRLGPYRLTFRMTRDQRRRLRIAAAKKDMSLQTLLSEALNAHLDSLCACALRECTCLAREEKD